MQCNFSDKKIAVFGANGSIGRGICKQMLAEGARVIAVTRSVPRAGELYRWLEENEATSKKVSYYSADVLNLDEVRQLTKYIGYLDGLVYSVGHCPPGGFDQAIESPPNQISADSLELELSTHVLGLQNVFKNILPFMNQNSVMVVMSSAVTALTDEACPPWLYAGHYAAAKAAQNEWIKWLRRDELVKEKGISIHRLSLSAVDTWFHQNTKHKPPTTISVAKVALETKKALCNFCAPEPLDKFVMPAN